MSVLRDSSRSYVSVCQHTIDNSKSKQQREDGRHYFRSGEIALHQPPEVDDTRDCTRIYQPVQGLPPLPSKPANGRCRGSKRQRKHERPCCHSRSDEWTLVDVFHDFM